MSILEGQAGYISRHSFVELLTRIAKDCLGNQEALPYDRRLSLSEEEKQEEILQFA